MNESLSYQVAEFLREHCPAFDFIPRGGPYNETGAVWHGCQCKITNESCLCVWHQTDFCHQGTWNMPFLSDFRREEQAKFDTEKKKMLEVPKEILRRKEKELQV